jgi:peptidoglycan/LPS O-acetylase OafA/YrhL
MIATSTLTGRAAPTHPEFRADVQGLRAVAVALVVLTHAGVPGLAGGFIGVDVFFVLSGFVITRLLLRERERTGRTSLTGFYRRRARRILPCAMLVLLVTVVAARVLLGSAMGARLSGDGAWTAVFLANVHFAAVAAGHVGPDLGPNPLEHYWSLAVEEQFYLVWPVLLILVMYLTRRSRSTAALAVVLGVICVASFTWCVVQTAHEPTWAYFSPLTRAWELATGALLALPFPALAATRARWPARAAGVLGLLAIGAAAVLYDPSTTFPGVAVALPVLGTALVIAAGTIAPGAGAAVLLAVAPLRWLGDRSYSLYLWHWPVLAIGSLHVGRDLPLAQDLGLVAVAVVASALTYRLVEDPLRRGRTREPAPRRRRRLRLHPLRSGRRRRA